MSHEQLFSTPETVNAAIMFAVDDVDE